MYIKTNVGSNIWFALYQGGPQDLAWGVLIVYIGAIAQAASIAEMSSTLPIAGARKCLTFSSLYVSIVFSPHLCATLLSLLVEISFPL